MKKLILLSIGFYLFADIIVIDAYKNKKVIDEIIKISKEPLIISGPVDLPDNLANFSSVIILGDKALEAYKKKNLEKPCVVGFLKNPFEEIPITGTGIRYVLPATKVIQIIANSCKWAKKIGTIIPSEYQGASYVKELQRASKMLGVNLKIIFLKGKALKKALNELKGINLLLLIPSELTIPEATARYLIQESFKMNIPVFGFERKHIEMGALMAYDLEKYYRKDFLNLLKTVFKGRNPAMIPVKYPENYEILIKKKIKNFFKLKINIKRIKNAREI